MRYLLWNLAGLWLIARAAIRAARRRAPRIRRYAERIPPPRPPVITGPIPLLRPDASVAPPVRPAGRHHRAGAATARPADLFGARDSRTRAQRRGLVALGAVGHHQRRTAVA